MQTSGMALATNEPDQTLPDRTKFPNGSTAMMLKLPNAMITMSRISDCAIADGGAVLALVLKFTQPPNFNYRPGHLELLPRISDLGSCFPSSLRAAKCCWTEGSTRPRS